MPPSQSSSFRGSSLYAGIFDSTDVAQSDSKEDRNADSTRPNEAGRTPSGAGATHAGSPFTSSGAVGAAASSSEGAASNSSSKPSSGWSAALRFAPRRNAATSRNKARPNAAIIASMAPPPSASEDVPAEASTSGIGSTSKEAASPALASTKNPNGILSSRASQDVKPSTSTATATPTTTAAAAPPSTPTPSKSTLSAIVPIPTSDDMAKIMARLDAHPVIQAPPYTLPPEVLEADKQMVRNAARARGESGGRGAAVFDSYEGWTDDRWDSHARADEDEDVNGFLATSAGRRAASRKKKKRKRGNSPPREGPNLNGDYDPRIPNDYLAFKQVVYDRRRAELDYQAWLDEQDDFDGYNDTKEGWEGSGRAGLDKSWEREEDEAQDVEMDGVHRREDKSSRFAPPDSYADSRVSGGAREQAGVSARNPHSACTGGLPGTEAAAVRQSQPQTGEEAYARRLAMTAASSGEEAYLRRLAMSSSSSSSSASGSGSGLAAPVTSSSSVARPFAAVNPPPPRGNLPPGPPPPRPPPASALGPDATQSTAQPQPQPRPVALSTSTPAHANASTPSDFAARQSAAAAIAARLAKAAPSASLPSFSSPSPATSANADARADPSTEVDVQASAGFAERLMAKYGYVKGSGVGLGVEGNRGIVEPLQHIRATFPRSGRSSANRGVIVSADPSSHFNSVSKHSHRDAATAGARGGAGAGGGGGGGRAYGQERQISSVLVLRGMLTLEELYASGSSQVRDRDGKDQDDVDVNVDMDVDVVQEIADECSKFGTVLSVKPHIHIYLSTPPFKPVVAATDHLHHHHHHQHQDQHQDKPEENPREIGKEKEKEEKEEVRIFVKFKGPSGAWSAQQSLHGRWFQARRVVATFYPESAFDLGNLDLDLNLDMHSDLDVGLVS
ncbi:hypothetical protein BCV70DRAFT_218917 [Testicularia cyperi]|uniref:G-patch domain-containing protein n=1 Tax=Testicularia cyperi TaxID=1882483 RepID=A0A317XIH9_9BASI|nr:hypothetical protein BCV70DRAFT_218917 [Testicularia cyperi]